VLVIEVEQTHALVEVLEVVDGTEWDPGDLPRGAAVVVREVVVQVPGHLTSQSQ